MAEEIERRHNAVAQLAATLTLARQQRDEYLRELQLARPVVVAAKEFRAAKIEIMKHGWSATPGESAAVQRIYEALDAASRARGEPPPDSPQP